MLRTVHCECGGSLIWQGRCDGCNKPRSRKVGVSVTVSQKRMLERLNDILALLKRGEDVRADIEQLIADTGGE